MRPAEDGGLGEKPTEVSTALTIRDNAIIYTLTPIKVSQRSALVLSHIDSVKSSGLLSYTK